MDKILYIYIYIYMDNINNINKLLFIHNLGKVRNDV